MELGDFMDFKNGKTSPERYDCAKYPVFGANGIIGYSDNWNADANTIIIGRVGSYCGSVYYSTEKCWVTDNAIIANTKNNDDYLFWYFYLKYIRLNSLKTGSGQPLLNQKILRTIYINNPMNISVRYSIGKILSTFDNKIQLNTQTNQTLEAIAQAIFKHWFIDFAPVHAKADALAAGKTAEQAELAAMASISGKTEAEIVKLANSNPQAYQQLQQTAAAFPSEFVESEMGLVPKGWEVLKFKDCVIETKERVGDLENITEYSVGNHGIYPRKEKYKKQLSKDSSKNKLVKKSSIVFGMGNKDVNWGIMKDDIGSVSSAYYVFLIQRVDHLYLDLFINSKCNYFSNIIKPTSRQGQSIDKDMFLDKYFYYPTPDILILYQSIFSDIKNKILNILEQNKTLAQTRDTLLPKLLSGEIEL